MKTLERGTIAPEVRGMLNNLNLVRLPGPAVLCVMCGRPAPVALTGMGPLRCPKCWEPLPTGDRSS